MTKAALLARDSVWVDVLYLPYIYNAELSKLWTLGRKKIVGLDIFFSLKKRCKQQEVGVGKNLAALYTAGRNNLLIIYLEP